MLVWNCGVGYHVGWSCEKIPAEKLAPAAEHKLLHHPIAMPAHAYAQHKRCMLPLRMLLLTLGVGAMSKAALAL